LMSSKRSASRKSPSDPKNRKVSIHAPVSVRPVGFGQDFTHKPACETQYPDYQRAILE
jgi:hypothetical protein